MKFRFKALERRRQPDQLDSPMMLTSPRGWVAVFVVLITAVFVGLWGILGSMPRTLGVQGIVGHPGGIVDVQAPASGTVTFTVGRQGDTLTAGDRIGSVQAAGGKTVPLVAPVSGRLVARTVGDAAIVAAGSPVLQVEAIGSPDEPLQVALFVDASRVPFIHPHQEVTLAVPGVSPRAFGRLRGTVESIAPYPVTTAELASFTGSQGLGQNAFSLGLAPRLVTVKLIPDRATFSGYAWTSASGPPIKLASRTPVDGEIEVGSISPFSMLIGG